MSQSNATYIESHILRRFNILKKVGSGAYGHVWKVEQKTTKKVYALKKIFDAFQHATDAQRTYRQIQILKQTQHPNIIKLHDTLRADNNKDVYLVFQFMQADLHNVISQDILKDVHIRFIIYQMAKALKYLHTGFIIHRDLKPSNVLVNSNCTIKLCDFGLVRSISSKNQSAPILTEGVATRWYRAPQVLLGSKSYSTPADIWSFGCIIYEILAQKPLFAGNSTLDQLQKICQFTGYPTQEDIKSVESQVSKSMLKEIKLHIQSYAGTILKQIPGVFRDLIQKMVVFNPSKRITIEQILCHEAVKAFHKPQQQISCKKQITTSIDDNKKFSVDQYRRLIYGNASNAERARVGSVGSMGSMGTVENQSLIMKRNSAKIIKKPSQLAPSNTLSKLLNQKQKPQITKKFSYDNLKTLNKTSEYKSISQYIPSSININNNNNNNININNNNIISNNLHSNINDHVKKNQKQTLKYVRSAKQFLRTSNQQPQRNIYGKKITENNKSTVSLGNYLDDKKQDNINKNNSTPSVENNKYLNNANRLTYVTKTFYSPKNYLESTKNYIEPTKSTSNHIPATSNQYLSTSNQYPTNSNQYPTNSSQYATGQGHIINTSNHLGTNSHTPGSSVAGTNNNESMWSSSKVVTNKDNKEKTYLFKSQKYIRDFKSTSFLGSSNDSNILIKKEQKK